MRFADEALEREIERPASKKAKKLGWIVIKLAATERRGRPDRLYIKGGRFVFVEWKRLGEDATEQQALVHTKLRAAGAEVYVCDNEADFLVILSR